MAANDPAEIVPELPKTNRELATIDRTVRGSVRDEIRGQVRRILRVRGYLPDGQARAVETVMKQAEVWAA